MDKEIDINNEQAIIEKERERIAKKLRKFLVDNDYDDCEFDEFFASLDKDEEPKYEIKLKEDVPFEELINNYGFKTYGEDDLTFGIQVTNLETDYPDIVIYGDRNIRVVTGRGVCKLYDLITDGHIEKVEV